MHICIPSKKSGPYGPARPTDHAAGSPLAEATSPAWRLCFRGASASAASVFVSLCFAREVELRSRYSHGWLTGDAGAVGDDAAFLPGLGRLPIPRMKAISAETAHRIKDDSTDRSWLWDTVLRCSQEPLSLVQGCVRAMYAQCGCKVAATPKFWIWRGPRGSATEAIVISWETWCAKEERRAIIFQGMYIPFRPQYTYAVSTLLEQTLFGRVLDRV